MNDRELLPIRPDDVPSVQPTEAPAAATASTIRRRSSSAPDWTTRLVADVLGMAPDRAGEILASLGGLEALAFASESDLATLAISRNRARLVRAAFELARQSIGCRPQIGQRLAASSDVWTHMRARLSGVPVEEFWALALDVRHRVVLDSMIARGSLTGVEVHPRDVFRGLIKAGAAAVIFCHYVARNIMAILCPGPLCGGVFQRHGYRGPGEPGRPHNDRPQSAASQDSSAGSSRQEAPFTGRLSWAIGGSVRRSAASLTRVLISAYRFVVASPA